MRCGGTYHKVKEPEGYGKKKSKAESSKDNNKAEGKKPVGNGKPSSTATPTTSEYILQNLTLGFLCHVSSNFCFVAKYSIGN